MLCRAMEGKHDGWLRRYELVLKCRENASGERKEVTRGIGRKTKCTEKEFTPGRTEEGMKANTFLIKSRLGNIELMLGIRSIYLGRWEAV